MQSAPPGTRSHCIIGYESLAMSLSDSAAFARVYLRSEVGGRNVVKRLKLSGWTSYRSIAAVWRRGAAFTEHFANIADLIGDQARRTLNEARPSFT